MPRTLFFEAPRSPRLFYASTVPEAVRVDPANPKWVQICTAGSYVYRGEPVTIGDDTFDQMIANVHAHPAYKADARSLLGRPIAEVAPLVTAGVYGVVALNFDHPPVGGPRPGCGWILDAERRPGEGGGPSTLWALTFFDADAYSAMLAGKWRWTSIEWTAFTPDPKTGKDLGAYLSGCALTNDPFIQGMTPIQMGREQGAVIAFGAATDVLCELRYIFALPETADVGAVIAEVAKLRAWAIGEMSPPLGVDVGALVGRIRRLLNLPTLSDPAIIFVELNKLLARLAAETPEEIPMGNDSKTPENGGAALGLARLFATMLSAKLGTAIGDDEASLRRAFDAMGNRYDEATSHLQALQKIFGTTDPKEISEKLASMQALSDQMTQLLGEVKAEHDAEEAAEGQMAASDVAQVMQAQRLDPATAPGTVRAYTAQRLGFAQPLVVPTAAQVAKDPSLFVKFFADARKHRELRRSSRAAFFEAHGITDLARVQAALPSHLRGALAPALFGNGGVFAPGTGPQPGQGAPNQGQGQPMQFGNNSGAASNAWTMARVQALPPGPNDAQRIFDEVVRTEHGGKVTPGSQAYTAAWSRVNAILSDISRQQQQAWS